MKNNIILTWVNEEDTLRRLKENEFSREWLDYMGYASNKEAIIDFNQSVETFKDTEYTLALFIDLTTSQQQIKFVDLVEEDLEQEAGKIYLEHKNIDWGTGTLEKLPNLFTLDVSNLDVYYHSFEGEGAYEGWHQTFFILSKFRFDKIL